MLHPKIAEVTTDKKTGGLSLALVEAAAQAAHAAAPGVDVGVDTVEGVSAFTGILRRVSCLKGVASKQVNPACHRFQVPRPHAEWHSAEMVDMEAGRNGAVSVFPRKAMSAHGLLGCQREAPVAVRGPACCPEPALPKMWGIVRDRGTCVHLRPEPPSNILLGAWADPEVDRNIAMHAQPLVMSPAEAASVRRFLAGGHGTSHRQKYTTHR